MLNNINTYYLVFNEYKLCNELGQASGDGEGWRGLACYSSWGLKDSDMTGWLNNKYLIKV